MVTDGFIELQPVDFDNLPERRAALMLETIEYWPTEGRNALQDTEFVGVGYVKKVLRTKEPKGNIKTDKFGRPKLMPDLSRGLLH